MTSAEEDTPQPLAVHLLELRKRLLRIIALVLLIFAGLFSYANELYQLVAQPLLDVLPEGSTMLATDVASPFLTPFKLSLFLAFFIAIPYILFEAWGFIAPGLFKKEKRLFAPLLCISVILFYSGIAFAYFAVLPVMFQFLSGTTPEQVTYAPDIAQFLSTVIKIFFAFGIVFQIPILTLTLIHTGARSIQQLKQIRPYMVIACFTIAMFLTPPDPLSQFMMAIPMLLLYELGLILANFLPKKPEADQ